MSKKEFRALRELALFVNKNKVCYHELIEAKNGSSEKTKIDEFYEGIVSEEFMSDEDAAFGLDYEDPQNQVYKNLRTQLQKRLLNTVFLIDLYSPSQTDRQKAYFDLQKDWAAAKMLIGKNARTIGIRLCHKILRKARRYEFTELVLDITRMLRLHYGTREGDVKRFEQFNEMYKEFVQIWQDENLAEEYYAELVTRYANAKAIKETTHEKAREYYEALADIRERTDAYRAQLCIYLIRLTIHSSLNDYKGTVDVSEEAVALFEKKPYLASVPLQIFYYQLLVCYTQLKQYERGKVAAQKCLELLEEGSFNWFKYQELYFTLSMHTRNYQEAYHLYNNTIYHSKYQYLPAGIKETWKIFEAYLHYLVDIGKIQPEEDDNRFNKFRLGRFLNETPIFSKDKRGMNIPILVIQILHMIQQEKYDDAIDRIEAIEKYCSRYLRKDDTFRSNCFIKMLLQIPASSFHKAAVVRKTVKYTKKLQEVPLDIANQSHEIEIIPYEDLWDMVIETLDFAFH